MPAGTYHFVMDCIVLASADVSFGLEWRHGSQTTVLTHWSKHFDPVAAGYEAQAYETNRTAPAITFSPGDQLVLTYSAANTNNAMAWIPNGDGASQGGRIPNITLPR